jgi:hypothetical protein
MAKFKSKTKGGSRLSGSVSRETEMMTSPWGGLVGGMTKGDRRPSVTNSAWASHRLQEMGLGIREFGILVQEAITSELVSYSKSGKKNKSIPDWQTRRWAADKLEEIHGWKHIPEQKTSVTVEELNIVNEVRKYETSILIEREKDAKDVLRRAERLGMLGEE